MPLYDYQCDKCGHRFEVRQGIKEDPLTECPQCGGSVRRVIHPVGIVFKGSGFYVTDSRSKSAAASTPSTDGADGDKAEKKEPVATADSKPAADGKAAANPPATTTSSTSTASPSSESKSS